VGDCASGVEAAKQEMETGDSSMDRFRLRPIVTILFGGVGDLQAVITDAGNMLRKDVVGGRESERSGYGVMMKYGGLARRGSSSRRDASASC
jgi:hypothetical protein